MTREQECFAVDWPLETAEDVDDICVETQQASESCSCTTGHWDVPVAPQPRRAATHESSGDLGVEKTGQWETEEVWVR